MKTNLMIVYECEICGRLGLSEKEMNEHEPICKTWHELMEKNQALQSSPKKD